jgi:hypothetical protein
MANPEYTTQDSIDNPYSFDLPLPILEVWDPEDRTWHTLEVAS